MSTQQAPETTTQTAYPPKDKFIGIIQGDPQFKTFEKDGKDHNLVTIKLVKFQKSEGQTTQTSKYVNLFDELAEKFKNAFDAGEIKTGSRITAKGTEKVFGEKNEFSSLTAGTFTHHQPLEKTIKIDKITQKEGFSEIISKDEKFNLDDKLKSKIEEKLKKGQSYKVKVDENKEFYKGEDFVSNKITSAEHSAKEKKTEKGMGV